ncbi:MAG TPA: TIGR02594 family protein [Bacteroidales bacterium]|nr:TIGR02594 family protein [Bacteroidales bacterium]
MKKIVEIALHEFGQKEIAGIKHNERIVNYAREIGLDWVNDDETPWCSIFMNWCAMKAGAERTGKATARSWLSIGSATKTPALGDIVVLRRGTSAWQGHVGLYITESEGIVYVLGGNQANSVNINACSKKDVLGYRKIHEV